MTLSRATRDPSRPPELQPGDRLTRDEFERRYAAMPDLKKAELIDGRVYMPSPVRFDQHGRATRLLSGWLLAYELETPGVDGADNVTVRLDLDNEPQPDHVLRVLPSHGGRTRTADGYLEGGPELVVEVSASSASYDLHEKLDAYRRHGVQEYVVWRVLDGAVDWFVLRSGRYEPLMPDPAGRLRSEVFPGLWLDPVALVAGDARRFMSVLAEGLTSGEHTGLVERLRAGARAD